MSRAEFWGKKLLLAESLGTESVKAWLVAIEPEVVSFTKDGEGVIIREFSDGSFLRAQPFDLLGNKKGWVDWTK
jgi:hypothetical protein